MISCIPRSKLSDMMLTRGIGGVWSMSMEEKPLCSRSILHTYFLSFLILFFMFEFEKLLVYQRVKLFNQSILAFAYENSSIDKKLPINSKGQLSASHWILQKVKEEALRQMEETYTSSPMALLLSV
ncbi:MAG TPA: hypothetical protein VK766_07070 [Cytophagaceae bacterium]|jgi:hypothetical protein|nr:hypothetical protein [Cytophagaceae bacterium]